MLNKKRETKLFDPALVNTAIKQSFIKLSPRFMVKNPVMFTVELGTLMMLAVVIWQMITHSTSQGRYGIIS